MTRTKYLTHAAITAAVYIVITVIFAPISYGQVQVRISEALTILPYFTPAAIPGLFVGCLLANIYGGAGLLDIVFGSLATLLAAFLSYKMPKKYLVPFPPVIVNAIVIGFVLFFAANLPLFITMAWVGLGQLIACYGIGYPLMVLLEKYDHKIFL